MTDLRRLAEAARIESTLPIGVRIHPALDDFRVAASPDVVLRLLRELDDLRNTRSVRDISVLQAENARLRAALQGVVVAYNHEDEMPWAIRDARAALTDGGGA